MPATKVFLMGENIWIDLPDLTENVSTKMSFYLTGGNANSINGNGKLSEDITMEINTDKYLYDPNNPVPTYGGANFHWFKNWLGIKDQNRIEERNDVLVYTSDKLNKPLTILGPIKADLYVSTEGFDTDFTAKLVEVYSNGYARIIEEGIVRLSRMKDPDNKEKIIPGKIYKAEINLGFTGITLKEGSSIRLEVSSSNFPKYDRNPNTGEDAYDALNLKPVIQTVYQGNKYPSKITFSVLDNIQLSKGNN